MPKRIQRQRTAGWQMPPNTVYVGRPTKWGNNYVVGTLSHDDPPKPLTAQEAVELFEMIQVNEMLDDEIDFAELRGKDLACWCPLDRPCHADVLLKLANEKPKEKVSIVFDSFRDDRHLFDEWYRIHNVVRCSYCGTRQILNLRKTGSVKCVACTAPLGISFFRSKLEVPHGTE
jgi:hypothetical protein